MTDADRDKLLLEILGTTRANTERLERVHGHTEALKLQVGSLHDDMLLVKQRRDDHTVKIEKLAAEVEQLKLGAAAAGGAKQGMGLMVRGGWAVLVLGISTLLGLAGLAVSLIKH